MKNSGLCHSDGGGISASPNYYLNPTAAISYGESNNYLPPKWLASPASGGCRERLNAQLPGHITHNRQPITILDYTMRKNNFNNKRPRCPFFFPSRKALVHILSMPACALFRLFDCKLAACTKSPADCPAIQTRTTTGRHS